MSFLSSKKSSKSGRSGSGSNSRSSTSSKTKTSSKESSNPPSTDNDDDGWNAWEWSAQWQREWRSREKPDGSWEYQYRQPDPSDDTPRFIGSGDSLATIGEDVVSGSDFTHSPQPPGTLQPLSSQSRPGQYPSALGQDSGYGYNTASRPIPINRSPGYLQGSPNLQQGVSSSYGTGIPGMSTSTDVLLQSSGPHQPTDEEDDYSDDDTVDASAEESENLQISRGSRTGGGSNYSQSMVDDQGIPIRQSNPLLNTQEEEDVYDDDTVATTNPTQSSYSSNLQRVPNSQQDVGLSFSTRIPGMSKNTNKPLQGSIRHQNTEEKGGYSDDDTFDASAEEFENLQISRGSRTGGGSNYSRSMVDDEDIPIRQSNTLLNPQEEENIYDDDTAVATNPTQFSYSIRSPAATSPFPSAYPQSGNSSAPYEPLAPTIPEQALMAMSPSSEQVPTSENTHILGTATVAEDSMSPQQAALHGSFRVHPAKDFEFGKVFKILWTEPKGQSKAAKGTDVVPTIYGEQFYTSIRRFVIYSLKQGHCLCLPILTYNRQGTAKAGAKAQDHAIIYTRGRKGEIPKETEFEEKLSKEVIRMEPRTPRDQLALTSRLNYAKIYTVEYNVKVSFIGRIAKESVEFFIRDFNLVHKPLPQAETEFLEDDRRGLEHVGEREPEPQNRHHRRGSEPSYRHRGSQGEQPNQGQHKRKKKGGK